MLTVIYAQERTKAKDREKIDWKLITNLSVRWRGDALEKLAWYGMRWKIETFRKILKSGCKAEASKLCTAERIVNLIAVFYILSWRIFWMTMMNRVAPTASPTIALTTVGMHVLDLLIYDKTASRRRKANLALLPHEDCPARRLSRTRERSSARQRRHVARSVHADASHFGVGPIELVLAGI